MKKFLLAFTLFLLGGAMLASAQTVEVKIKNQYIKGTEFFFDVYLEKTAGDSILMGYADIVIDNAILTNGGFVNPALNYVTGSNAFKNAAGNSLTTTYDPLIATTITGSPNANRMIINLNLAGFNENAPSPGDAIVQLAYLNASDTSNRLGTFRITGLTGSVNANSFYPNANFSITGAGIKVKVYKIGSYGPYTQTRLTENVVSTASVLETAPTSAQLAGISLTKDGTGSTPTSMKFDWSGVAAANGDSLLIIVRSRNGGAASNDSTPGDGLRYFANNDWGARTDANRIGQSPWYVVYRGSSANGSVTISNLSNAEEYVIRAVPYAGVGGYNSAYASQADLHSNNATIQIITTPTATEPTTQIAGITLTTNQSNPNTSISFQIDTTNFTAGDSVIVLVKAATAFNPATDRPVDGTFYDGSNLNFATASAVGDAKVVYRGLLTSNYNTFNVTNLTANTQYFFEAVIYRGTSGALSQNYLVDAPNLPAAANRYTTPLPIDPSIAANQSRDLVLTTSGVGEINVSWTNGTAGTGTIVIAREAGATNASPVQGTHYSTANADFSSAPEIGTSDNFIVYSGTGTSVAVTGLKPNQRYHFSTVRYIGNIANAGNINYIQDGGGSNWGRGNENTYMNVTAKASFETMGTLLTDATNLVPLAQPFNSANYGSYAGSESVASIPNGVVDWVLLELRRTTTGSLTNAGPSSVPGSGATLIGRRAAFLKSDGSIVSTSGDTSLQFNIPDEGQFFLVVYHRNHLPIMTSTANALGLNIFQGGAGTANLTVPANVAGTAGTEFYVDGGVAKMWSGNVDPSDYVIDGDDRAGAWTNRNTEDAYNIADVDLDRNVSARDFSFIWNNRTKAAYVRIAQN